VAVEFSPLLDEGLLPAETQGFVSEAQSGDSMTDLPHVPTSGNPPDA
jgi:hypothetical protein